MKTLCVTGAVTADDASFDRLLEGFRGWPPDYFEVRDKAAPDRRVVDLLERAIAALSRERVLANARFDLALAAGAGGVVLPEDGVPVPPIRRETPRGFRIGKSTHSAEAARRAADDGADLVLLGPIFATPSKAVFGRPLTPAVLDRLEGDWPPESELFLIGGIGVYEVEALSSRRAKFAGVAGIRVYAEALDPGAVVRELRAR
jgi:thiamine-phosphate diphosphorylase